MATRVNGLGGLRGSEERVLLLGGLRRPHIVGEAGAARPVRWARGYASRDGKWFPPQANARPVTPEVKAHAPSCPGFAPAAVLPVIGAQPAPTQNALIPASAAPTYTSIRGLGRVRIRGLQGTTDVIALQKALATLATKSGVAVINPGSTSGTVDAKLISSISAALTYARTKAPDKVSSALYPVDIAFAQLAKIQKQVSDLQAGGTAASLAAQAMGYSDVGAALTKATELLRSALNAAYSVVSSIAGEIAKVVEAVTLVIGGSTSTTPSWRDALDATRAGAPTNVVARDDSIRVPVASGAGGTVGAVAAAGGAAILLYLLLV